MKNLTEDVSKSLLFAGMAAEEIPAVLQCVGYHVKEYRKGETVILEESSISHIGIILSGAVDMVKEDIWGNKTLLVRMHAQELFGETFACGSDQQSAVTFTVPERTRILFLPFHRVIHTCQSACEFHYKLIVNMVRLIADRNRELMRKIEIISKKTLREKIFAYLSMQAQEQKTRYFQLPLNKAELAEYMCADRSALSRELSRMKADGLIDFDKNMYRIL